MERRMHHRKDFIIPLNTPSKFYHSIIDILDSAERGDQVLCNYFVVRFDNKGKRLLHSLILAASRGAEIKLIIDSYGSLHKGDNGTEYTSEPLNMSILRELEARGVQCFVYRHIQTTKFFHPQNILNWTNYSRRNHNKNFLFNLRSKNKRGLIIGDSQWADEHFNDCFRGNNTYIESDRLFEKVFEYHRVLLQSDQITRPQIRAKIECLNSSVFNSSIYRNKKKDYRQSYWYISSQRFFPESIKFVSNEINFSTPTKRKTIQDHEMQIMNEAKNSILYATPYFCPDKTMRENFKINRNKDLRILIAKFRKDPFIPYGTKLAAKNLISHNISIFEYQGNGNIHYKDLIADDISFIKTANGEGRSRFFNLETGVIIKDARYATLNRRNIQKDINISSRMNTRTRFISEPYLIKRLTKQALCPLYYHHL